MFSTDLPAGNDFRILDTLSRTSLAEHHELAAFTCLSPSSTLDGLRRLQVEGLVAFVRHTRTGTSRVRRWHLTPLGITRLAELLGATVGGLLRERPLSAEWLTSLLQRLDAVAAFYRVAQEVASSCDGPIGWRWRIAWPLDALLELPDGRGFALMRLGATLSWKAMRSRIGTLYGMQRVRSCPPALLLLPGNLEAQRLRADMRGRAIDVFAAVDDDVMCAAPGSAVWRTLRRPESADVRTGHKRLKRPAWDQAARWGKFGAGVDTCCCFRRRRVRSRTLGDRALDARQGSARRVVRLAADECGAPRDATGTEREHDEKDESVSY